MIKKIPVASLIPGMYIQDVNCGWMEHPFINNSFMVNSEALIERIRSLGVQELYIDTEQGLDDSSAPTLEEVNSVLQRRMENIANTPAEHPRKVDLPEEAPRAKKIHLEANRIIKNVMADIRMGAQIDLNRIEPLVEPIIDSIFNNSNAFLPLSKLKHHDTYTFEHSVSVCALMVTFARELNLPMNTIREIAIGALLHDVGKSRVPEAILNKPDRLTDREFALMKDHVVQSTLLLQKTPGISPVALLVTSQHHERYDGSGYPQRLQGKHISLYGQMAAIVDVYDAISSNRVYHKGLQPSLALKKLLEWSDHHFDVRLVHNFIRSIGIYPTGSLVQLQSQRLAIVREQNETNLLHPQVLIIYNIAERRFVAPLPIDLAKSGDHIINHEDFGKWNINPRGWLPE